MCDQYDETVDHLVSSCPVICPTEYKNRHDRVGQYIHWKVCQHYKARHHKTGMNRNQNLLLKQSATILWDFAIKIYTIKPDITIKDHKSNSFLLVELMLPMDKNLSSGEFGKTIKFQGPGNRNRTNVAPKTIIDTCSCGSSWYSKKKGINEFLQQIPGKALSI